MRTTISVSLLIAFTAGEAAAEVERCAGTDTDLSWTGTDLAQISGDTGWFPSSSVAQLRLTGRVVGHTAVDAGMRTQACWNEVMQASLTGRDGAGYLDVAYGAELHLYGRIRTTVLGKTINWEGEIAIPNLPNDLLLAGEIAFDPTVDATHVTRVSDSTSPIPVLSTDVIGSLIAITGISGGLHLTMTPVMSTSYRTRSAKLDGVSITSSADHVTLARPDAGFGASIELPVSAGGLIRYEPSLRFAASFDVKIFGVRVVQWQLFSIPMNLPALERPIQLTGTAAHIPLPALEGLGEGARMDFATGTTQELRVRNVGEGPLAVEVKSAPAGVLVSALDIPARGDAPLQVFVADDAVFAGGPVSIVVATNDPDRPSITIQLGKNVGGTDGDDPDLTEDAAAGCSAGSTSGFGTLLVVGILLVGRRRRRVA